MMTINFEVKEVAPGIVTLSYRGHGLATPLEQEYMQHLAKRLPEVFAEFDKAHSSESVGHQTLRKTEVGNG